MHTLSKIKKKKKNFIRYKFSHNQRWALQLTMFKEIDQKCHLL